MRSAYACTMYIEWVYTLIQFAAIAFNETILKRSCSCVLARCFGLFHACAPYKSRSLREPGFESHNRASNGCRHASFGRGVLASLFPSMFVPTQLKATCPLRNDLLQSFSGCSIGNVIDNVCGQETCTPGPVGYTCGERTQARKVLCVGSFRLIFFIERLQHWTKTDTVCSHGFMTKTEWLSQRIGSRLDS